MSTIGAQLREEKSMSLKKGQRVRHPIQFEWGLGEVLADPGEDKVRVFFVGAGEKILSLKYVTLQSVPKEEAAHPVLDNLRVPREGGHEYQSLQESVERFLEQYPLGFRGDRFVKEERDYKVRAHQLAQETLSKGELARLLSTDGFAEICRRVLQVSNAANLIFPHEKMSLRDGLKSPASQDAFVKSLFDLLYGEDDLSLRFERHVDILEGIGAAKWTIATYFLFIVYPEQYMFLKPAVTQNAADISGFEINYRPGLNWHTYKSVLSFANYLKAELVELAPRDMIDVQSFMWCIGPEKP